MPDWLTHVLVVWSLCTIIGFRYKQFSPENTAIAMLGALLPDAVKIAIPFQLLTGYDPSIVVATLHMPVGSIILAAMCSLLFKEKKTIFLFLLLGVLTHFGLDLLMTYYSGGTYLFFPLNWGQWQVGLISTVDYKVSLLAIIVAIYVYLIARFRNSIHVNR
jgi:membrane-bound metal-dependent hydrolase YbcI (DUF457 family)